MTFYGMRVRWYDYLWLLIPIAGFAYFVLVISLREERE